MVADLPAEQRAICVDQYADERADVERRLLGDAWQKIELLESEMERMPQVALPLVHRFTPGLYIRQITMPKGTLLTTRIHLSEHPFAVMAGVVSVWDDEHGCLTLTAPHVGITKPGTRRILFVHETCVWLTFHVTNETDPDEIVKQITYADGKFSELRGAKA